MRSSPRPACITKSEAIATARRRPGRRKRISSQRTHAATTGSTPEKPIPPPNPRRSSPTRGGGATCLNSSVTNTPSREGVLVEVAFPGSGRIARTCRRFRSGCRRSRTLCRLCRLDSYQRFQAAALRRADAPDPQKIEQSAVGTALDDPVGEGRRRQTPRGTLVPRHVRAGAPAVVCPIRCGLGSPRPASRPGA